MRKVKLFMSIVWLMSLAFALQSCEKEPEKVGPNGGTTNPDKVVADPEGTVVLSMRDIDNGNIRIDDRIYINKENWTGEGCSYVSLGEMKGLGNIESIPTTGWAAQMGVYPSNGYVAYNRNNDTYYRLYVTDYLYNTSDVIIGAKVKYQKPFCGRDELIKINEKSLSFTAKGGTEKVFFKNTSMIPFKVSNNQSWCRVQRISSSDYPFLYDGIAITTEASGLPISSSDTIKIETYYGKSTLLFIEREGHAYLEVSSDTLVFSAYNGYKTLTLKTNMDWEAYANASWIEISSKAGSGGTSMTVTVSANSTNESRTGIVTFFSGNKSVSVTVIQAGGSISIAPSSFEIKDSGETKTLKLTTPFTWTATASNSWLKISPDSGNGDATLTLSVEANNSTSNRIGTITVASGENSETIVVTQVSGSLNVSTTTLDFNDVGETKSLKLLASTSEIEWTATTSESWLKLSEESGNGNATLMVTAEANNNTGDRSGMIAIVSGENAIYISVTQTGGNLSVSSTTLNYTDVEETKTLKILTSNPQIPWTASTHDSWLKVSPESGSGNATLSITATTNNSADNRTGSIAIISGNKTISIAITQTGGSFSVSSSTLSFINAGETKSLKLQTSNPSLSWTATAKETWIKLSLSSGSGDATLMVTTEANNSTEERIGTVMVYVGDKSLSVTIIQAGGLVSISPSSLDFMDKGETKSLDLTTPFSWTASTSEPWLKLSSISGNRDATLMVTAEANNSSANRTGKITINSADKTITINATQAGGSLSVSTSIMNFIDVGETKQLELSTTTLLSWTAKTGESWLKISPASGSGNTTIMITAESNNSTSDRTSSVAITSGDKTIFVTSVQAGGTLSVAPSSQNLTEKGGSCSLELTTSTPFDWTATSGAPWITLSSTSGNGNSRITVIVSANDSPAERTGVVTFTSGKKSAVAHFYQDGVYSNTDWVNLGLPSGTLWALRNIGATTSEEHGAYYSWGELSEKKDYSWETYAFCNNANLKLLSKYNCDKNDGVVDNLTVLQSSDDAASKLFGGKMPTNADWVELIEKCEWTWTTWNNVQGYRVIGPNGKSIFLPTTGYKEKGGSSPTNSIGYYWSSSLYESYAHNAWILYFTSSNAKIDYRYRYLGLCIRPVYKP